MSFKAHSTAFSIDDSLKTVIPRSYNLSESGARLALKARVDAEMFEAKWRIADSELTKKTEELIAATVQNEKNAETIRILKRKLFWSNVVKYSSLTGAALLTNKLIFNP
jgi:hypothetical protein